MFPPFTFTDLRSTSHVADTLLFERAAVPSASRKDPERLFNGSFEAFGEAVGKEGLHLGQCAVRWLEALTISSDASYMKEQWAKEFLDTAMAVATMYEQSLLDRTHALLSDSSFKPDFQISLVDVEFTQCIFELFVNDLFYKTYERSTISATSSLTSSKGVIANEKFEKARHRVSRWKIVAGDIVLTCAGDELTRMKLSLRYRWACAVIAVCDSASNEVLFDFFNGLKEDMEAFSKHEEEIRIRLPNCPAIYEISAIAASREISKLQTIDYFRKMLQPSSSSDDEAIQELKRVLHPDPEAQGTLQVVQRFIGSSSLDFRLSLLHRLEELLYRSGSVVEALTTSLSQSLRIVGESLSTYDESDQISPRHREEIFLQTLKMVYSPLNTAYYRVKVSYLGH